MNEKMKSITHLGQYNLHEELGHGEFATVY